MGSKNSKWDPLEHMEYWGHDYYIPAGTIAFTCLRNFYFHTPYHDCISRLYATNGMGGFLWFAVPQCLILVSRLCYYSYVLGGTNVFYPLHLIFNTFLRGIWTYLIFHYDVNRYPTAHNWLSYLFPAFTVGLEFYFLRKKATYFRDSKMKENKIKQYEKQYQQSDWLCSALCRRKAKLGSAFIFLASFAAKDFNIFFTSQHPAVNFILETLGFSVLLTCY